VIDSTTLLGKSGVSLYDRRHWLCWLRSAFQN